MTQQIRTPIWVTILIAGSVAFSLGFACVTPFAAFAASAALTLSRRAALAAITGIFLANQIVGFFLLNYPWNASTFGWGAAISAAVVLGWLAAELTVSKFRNSYVVVAMLAGLLAAFAIYELTLFIVAVAAQSGIATFGPAVVVPLLLINLGAMALLLALHWLGNAAELLPSRESFTASGNGEAPSAIA